MHTENPTLRARKHRSALTLWRFLPHPFTFSSRSKGSFPRAFGAWLRPRKPGYLSEPNGATKPDAWHQGSQAICGLTIVKKPLGQRAHKKAPSSSRESNKRKKFLTDRNASSQSPFVCSNTPMLHDQISMTEIRPLRRIDDIALKRWAFFTVE